MKYLFSFLLLLLSVLTAQPSLAETQKDIDLKLLAEAMDAYLDFPENRWGAESLLVESMFLQNVAQCEQSQRQAGRNHLSCKVVIDKVHHALHGLLVVNPLFGSHEYSRQLYHLLLLATHEAQSNEIDIIFVLTELQKISNYLSNRLENSISIADELGLATTSRQISYSLESFQLVQDFIEQIIDNAKFTGVVFAMLHFFDSTTESIIVNKYSTLAEEDAVRVQAIQKKLLDGIHQTESTHIASVSLMQSLNFDYWRAFKEQRYQAIMESQQLLGYIPLTTLNINVVDSLLSLRPDIAGFYYSLQLRNQLSEEEYQSHLDEISAEYSRQLKELEECSAKICRFGNVNQYMFDKMGSGRISNLNEDPEVVEIYSKLKKATSL